MRVLMMVAALAAVSACNRGGSANNASGNHAKAADKAAPAARSGGSANATAAAAPAASGGMPDGFPANELASDGASCFVFLGMSQDAQNASTGFDKVAMSQAQDQWRSALRQELSEDETNQLLGSSVNSLMNTAAAQRDAASRWCVENAPEVDPEG